MKIEKNLNQKGIENLEKSMKLMRQINIMLDSYCLC